MNKVLVGVQEGEALEPAAEIASREGAKLVVVCLAPIADPRELFDPASAGQPARGVRAALARFPKLRTTIYTAAGDPAEQICRIAEEQSAELIVVGAEGRRFSTYRVADRVAGRAGCAVELIEGRRN